MREMIENIATGMILIGFVAMWWTWKKQPNKKKLLASILFTICSFILFGIFSDGNNQGYGVTSEAGTTTTTIASEIASLKSQESEYTTETSTSTTTETTENITIESKINKQEIEKIVDDKVVNNFIISFNAISDSDLIEIERGHIRTKFTARSFDYFIELWNSNDTDKISIQINGDDNKGIDGMRQLFRDSVKAIDKDLGDDVIYNFFDTALANDNYIVEKLGDRIEVRFGPDTMTYREFIDISEK